MTSERERQLEEVLAQFLKPVRGIPFEVVIRSLCNVAAVPFPVTDQAMQAVLTALAAGAESACRLVQAAPIQRPRPNEVGNDMEPVLVRAIKEQGLDAAAARTRDEKGKATGYPDIRLRTAVLPVYVEVKSYAADNHGTTQRSFYLSPADDPKVYEDGHHLVVGFEIEDRGVNGRRDDRGRALRNYVAVGYTIVDLYGLSCDMKAEFNSDNRRMYADGRVLAQAKV